MSVLILENIVMAANADYRQNRQDPSKNVANISVYENRSDGSSQMFRLTAWGRNADTIADGMARGEFLKGCRVTTAVASAPVAKTFTVKNGPNAGQERTSLEATLYYARSLPAQQSAQAPSAQNGEYSGYQPAGYTPSAQNYGGYRQAATSQNTTYQPNNRFDDNGGATGNARNKNIPNQAAPNQVAPAQNIPAQNAPAQNAPAQGTPNQGYGWTAPSDGLNIPQRRDVQPANGFSKAWRK